MNWISQVVVIKGREELMVFQVASERFWIQRRLYFFCALPGPYPGFKNSSGWKNSDMAKFEFYTEFRVNNTEFCINSVKFKWAVPNYGKLTTAGFRQISTNSVEFINYAPTCLTIYPSCLHIEGCLCFYDWQTVLFLADKGWQHACGICPSETDCLIPRASLRGDSKEDCEQETYVTCVITQVSR
jgi:hypothetical protein